MKQFIVACLVLGALAVAEPPQYRQSKYNQKQQEAPEANAYAAAGAPNGPLLLLPGEYLVKVAPNEPYQQFAAQPSVPEVSPLGQYNAPVAEIQYQPAFGQYAQPAAQQQFAFGQYNQYPQSTFGQQSAPNAFTQPQRFGLLQSAQKPATPQKYPQSSFSQKQQNGVFVPQANNPEAEVFNPQTFTPETQNQYNENNQFNRKSTAQKVNSGTPKREESEESVAKYQQASGKFQQTGVSGKYTAPQGSKKNEQTETAIQQQYNENLYDEDNNESSDFVARLQQEQTQFTEQQKYPIFFVNQQYFQQSDKPEVSGEYAQVNQYTASKKGSSEKESTEIASKTSKADYNKDASNPDAESVENAQEGLYYLLLPDGKLQKIVYMTKEDLKKMQLSANIQYQNVEPINGPVYTYNPAKSPFAKVF